MFEKRIEMQKLTKVEEQVMQYIWQLGRCTVSQIIAEMPENDIPHSTISSVARILEKKGYVGHKAYGRTYEYFPLITKKEYSKRSLSSLVSNYFEGSVSELVSFMVKEKDLSLEDLNALLKELKNKSS